MVQRISIALAVLLAGSVASTPSLTDQTRRPGAIIREAERNRRAYEAAQRRKFEDDLKTLSEVADELADLNEPLDSAELKIIREGGREIDKRIDRIIDYLGVEANPELDPPVAPPSDITLNSVRQLVNMLSRARLKLIRVAMDRTVLDVAAFREVVGDLEAVQLFSQPFKNAGQ